MLADVQEIKLEPILHTQRSRRKFAIGRSRRLRKGGQAAPCKFIVRGRDYVPTPSEWRGHQQGGGCPMRMLKKDFVELIASGQYYVLQKSHDRNRDDIALKREDGLPAEVHNYPYRVNQMPTYIFHELLDEGFLKEDGTDDLGNIAFRPVSRKREPSSQAA